MCSRDKFAFLTDFAWYLSVLCVLATVEGSQHGQDVADQLMEVTLRVGRVATLLFSHFPLTESQVDTIRPYAVECMLKLLLDDDLVLGRKRASVTAVLKAAAWIVGEYCEYLIDMVNDTKIDMVTEDDEAEGMGTRNS
jgi:AP-3 complex subunit delta-1